MPRGATEAEIVAGFRKKLYMQSPEIKWIAVPNAGRRGPAAVRQAKREGMQTGFVDGLCIWPGGGILFLEWKRNATAKASENQAEWLARLDRYGFPVALVSSADEALGVLRMCGAPVGGEA
jgi:ATP-dependent exoDNAse (exonuclease V) beta subunit